jgi:hypothetical protein
MHMRTTLNIDDKVLEKASKLTGIILFSVVELVNKTMGMGISNQKLMQPSSNYSIVAI